jgi:hypothetical protein
MEGEQPRITDFGLARRLEEADELTRTGQILGTPAYMPPEQASGRANDVGPACDIYSIGAVLYAMLVGKAPFQGTSATDTLLKVLDAAPTWPRSLNSRIPIALDTIVRKCMEKTPSMRYRSAGELKQDLDRFLAGEPITATRYTKLQRFVQWCGRKPTWAAILFALPLLMLGAYFSAIFTGAVNLGVRLPPPATWKRMVLVAVIVPLLAIFMLPLTSSLIAVAAVFLWLALITATLASVYLLYQSLDTGIQRPPWTRDEAAGELDLNRGQCSDLQRWLILSVFFVVPAYFGLMALDDKIPSSWFAPTDPVVAWDDAKPETKRIRWAKSLVGLTIKHRIERSLFKIPAACLTVIMGLAFGILLRIWARRRLRTADPDQVGEYLVVMVACVLGGLCAQHLVAPVIVEHWRYSPHTPTGYLQETDLFLDCYFAYPVLGAVGIAAGVLIAIAISEYRLRRRRPGRPSGA